jgi:TRAP-type C4-dicarboxylate transport system permease small subunit
MLESAEAILPVEPAPRPRGLLVRLCEVFCESALVIMGLMIAAEVTARSAFNISFEVADEIGAYLLVAITFMSLSVCLATNALHHVEVVQARLSPRARAWCAVLFDVLALAGSAIVLWQVCRLEWITWNSGDVSATWLMTPLWLPRLAMVVGMLVLCITLLGAVVTGARRAAVAQPH